MHEIAAIAEGRSVHTPFSPTGAPGLLYREILTVADWPEAVDSAIDMLGARERQGVRAERITLLLPSHTMEAFSSFPSFTAKEPIYDDTLDGTLKSPVYRVVWERQTKPESGKNRRSDVL